MIMGGKFHAWYNSYWATTLVARNSVVLNVKNWHERNEHDQHYL